MKLDSDDLHDIIQSLRSQTSPRDRLSLSDRSISPQQLADTLEELLPLRLQETGATASRVGDYGFISGRMATVFWQDRKFAECYTNEDAAYLARLINWATRLGADSLHSPNDPPLAAGARAFVAWAESQPRDRALVTIDEALKEFIATLAPLPKTEG